MLSNSPKLDKQSIVLFRTIVNIFPFSNGILSLFSKIEAAGLGGICAALPWNTRQAAFRMGTPKHDFYAAGFVPLLRFFGFMVQSKPLCEYTDKGGTA